MKLLYIGQNNPGSTSGMRARIIRNILQPDVFELIDTSIPFNETSRFFRSLGFRYKKGRLISNVNRYILDHITEKNYGLIWIDKGIYLTKETTLRLRSLTCRLVHFTPDPAFTFHWSVHFFRSISVYDYAVTSKSYELKAYYEILAEEKVILITQGFDKHLHRPVCTFDNKKPGVVFVGHCEREREKIVSLLLDHKIPVTIAGKYWKRFVHKYRNNSLLIYLGEYIHGEEYIEKVSAYWFSLGLLSKWVPELHTTRTFEIPACGTALITERNSETTSFFTDDDAIFYTDIREIPEKIKYYMQHPEELKLLSQRGHERVVMGGFDYETILRKALKKMELK